MEVLKVQCPRCNASEGEPCRSRESGQVRATVHDQRCAALRAYRRKSGPRHTIDMQLRALKTTLEAATAELARVRYELRESKIETKRLKRLLKSSDAGQVVGLRQRLAECESHVRRMKSELLS